MFTWECFDGRAQVAVSNSRLCIAVFQGRLFGGDNTRELLLYGVMGIVCILLVLFAWAAGARAASSGTKGANTYVPPLPNAMMVEEDVISIPWSDVYYSDKVAGRAGMSRRSVASEIPPTYKDTTPTPQENDDQLAPHDYRDTDV
jgi:hypothetical protein